MSYKVVRDAQGNWTGAAGPNDANYSPALPAGCTLSIEETMPAPLPAPDLTPLAIAEFDLYNKGIKALALAMLEEINALRQSAGLPPRTDAQVRTAFINKRKTL